MEGCLYNVCFGDIDEYGGVLFMLKIAATHTRGKYFTDMGLLGCPEVGNMATGIVAAHGKISFL